MVVVPWLTVCIVVSLLPRKLPSASVKVAVMTWEATVKALVTSTASPFASRDLVPIVVPVTESSNVTVPVGVV